MNEIYKDEDSRAAVEAWQEMCIHRTEMTLRLAEDNQKRRFELKQIIEDRKKDLFEKMPELKDLAKTNFKLYSQIIYPEWWKK
jgi:sRNA-binding carbon storage regulator CsrA